MGYSHEETYFDLTDEQRQLYRMLYDFSRTHLAPDAAELDQSGEWSWEGWEKLAEMSLLGLPLPEIYGGSGASGFTTALAMEAVTAGGADAGLMLSWGAHTVICTVPIWKLGSEEQKRKYLPKLTSGEWVGALALTEPNSGSDAGAGGLQTRAVRQDDHYVLNGSKMFITNGPIARVIIVIAMTDPKRGRNGASAFILDTDTPGFSAGKPLDKLGNRSSPTSELTFKDCIVPAEQMLGREGDGLSVVGRLTLEWERAVLMAPALGGIAHGLLQSMQYARERQQFGRPLSDFQAIRHKLADMAVDLEASRLHIRRAAWMKDRDQAASLEAAEAKLYAAEAQMRTASEAIQIHGGYGYIKEFAVERGMRNGKLAEIGAGTSEMQRLIISHGALKDAPLQGYPLNDEQLAYWRTVREFMSRTIAPRAVEIDARGEFSLDNLRDLVNFGYLGLAFPEEYGGSGADQVTTILAAVEMSRACASTALSVGASTALCASPILLFGNNVQKDHYLDKLLRGEWIGALGLTEPGAGSDVAAIQTHAVREGDQWILSGSKMFITNGPIADLVLVLAVTDMDKRANDGMTAFLVERSTHGFSHGKPLDKLGCRGSPTSELTFNKCRVPDENVLGEIGQGFPLVMQVLQRARVGFAAWCLGIAQACLDEAIKYANQREAFGQVIGKFQAIRFMIADMRTAIDTACLMTLRAAWLIDQDRPFTLEASAAKLVASKAATLCAHLALQIHGGYGYIKEFPVERLYRDARLAEIGEGTTEIQKDIIADTLLRSDNPWRLVA